jgi:serine/threonine protein kinase
MTIPGKGEIDMGTLYGDRWECVESLGEGGQAHTFLVKDLKGHAEDRYVLKRLKNIDRLGRFKQEIEAIGGLEHPNIVRLIDYDLEGAKPYLVTEYCSGGSLDRAEAFWKESPLAALEIFRQVCEGVAYAHSHGIVHRDLKPANIFLRNERGPAVVGHFGICYVEEDGTRVTLTEEAVGPVYYMAPELEDRRVAEVSERSDTYSLGKLLYWLLSGGKVFSREKHRDKEWDLKGWDPARRQWKNIYMEHVNRLLDLMIAQKVKERPLTEQLLWLVPDVTRLVQKEFTPISGEEVLAPCLFCGQGQYRPFRAGKYAGRDFGFTLCGSADFRILVCDTCGHVQVFRIEDAKKKEEWWQKRPD